MYSHFALLAANNNRNDNGPLALVAMAFGVAKYPPG